MYHSWNFLNDKKGENQKIRNWGIEMIKKLVNMFFLF